MSNDIAGASPVDRTVRPAAEARWYCLDRDGVAMLCKDEADARAQVIEHDDCWPRRAPHRAALLGDVSAADAHIPMARLIELETAEQERDIFRSERFDLALLVGRLIRRMRAARTGEGIAAGDDALEQQCIGYLRRKGLTSPLREEGPNVGAAAQAPAEKEQR